MPKHGREDEEPAWSDQSLHGPRYSQSLGRGTALAAVLLGTVLLLPAPTPARAANLAPPSLLNPAPGVTVTPLSQGAREQAKRRRARRLERPTTFDASLAETLPADQPTDVAGPLAAPSTVTAEGPTAGPLGLIIPYYAPICATSDHDKAILVVFIDHEEIEFIHGTGLSYQDQWTLWTLQTPEEALGTHELSVGCYDSGTSESSSEEPILFTVGWESEAIWKHDGFEI